MPEQVGRFALLLFGWLLLPGSGRAAPSDDSVEECALRAEQGQSAQRQGELRQARESFLACGTDACPAVVRRHCLEWLKQVEADLPSVIVRARDARGRDVVGVRVVVDDAQALDRLDGRPLSLDPGVHRFRLGLAGAEGTEQVVVLAPGEKNRAVAFALDDALDVEGRPVPSPPPAAPPAGPKPPTSSVSEASQKSGPDFTLAYVFGGASVATFAAGSVIWLGANSDYQDVNESCQTEACSPEEIAQREADYDAIEPRFIAATVLFGVSAVSLGLTVWQVIANAGGPPARSAAATTSFAVSPGLQGSTFRVSF